MAPPANTPQPLETFRQEVLRWNRQINLVSRQETGDRLEALLGQCRDGVPPMEAWLAEVLPRGPVWYFDLGSGGGLPGVVWHLGLSGAHPLHTWLVEPRDKRAWFLERVANIPHMPPFGVLQARWDEARPDSAPPRPGAVIVSLKALKLTDPEILDGLAAFSGGELPLAPVMVARYHPPEQIWSTDLAAGLEIPAPGTPAGPLVSVGAGVTRLGDTAGASLVVSTYRPAG